MPRRRPTRSVGVDAKTEFTAGAFVLVEEIGRKIHPVAHAPTEQITDRAARRLAHQIEQGHLDGAVDMHNASLVPWLIATGGGPLLPKPFKQARLDCVELKWVFADDYLTGGFQCAGGGDATRHLAQPIEAIVGDNFDDGAQRVGRM